MRTHRMFIGLVAFGSVLTLVGCGSSTATTSSATTAAAATASGAGPTGSSTPDGSAATDTTGGGTANAGTSATAPQTASPGVPAPRDSIVAAPGRVVPTTDDVTPDPVDPTLQPSVDLAIADLAKQLRVDASEITTVSAETIEWADKSDGCPEPGMSYSQITVDGVFIVLGNNGMTYEYHGGGSRAPFLCKNG